MIESNTWQFFPFFAQSKVTCFFVVGRIFDILAEYPIHNNLKEQLDMIFFLLEQFKVNYNSVVFERNDEDNPFFVTVVKGSTYCLTYLLDKAKTLTNVENYDQFFGKIVTKECRTELYCT